MWDLQESPLKQTPLGVDDVSCRLLRVVVVLSGLWFFFWGVTALGSASVSCRFPLFFFLFSNGNY